VSYRDDMGNGKRPRAWSVAGAARFAREARIATVRHQRTAPVARMWEMANLQSAYQMHLAHLGSPEAAWGQLFGGLGYAGRFAAGWEEAVSIFMADEARYLADADLYVLTPQMCDTVIPAALNLTVDDLTLIDAGDLPRARVANSETPAQAVRLPLQKALEFDGQLAETIRYYRSPGRIPVAEDRGRHSSQQPHRCGYALDREPDG
jgi:hypothetical protein